MKLNLQILELELADICIQCSYVTDRYQRTLRFPVVAERICKPTPDRVYLIQPYVQFLFSDSSPCSFICIGSVPSELLRRSCNWLLLKADTDLYFIMEKLQELFERYHLWELSLMKVISEKLPVRQIGVASESFLRHPFQLYDSNFLCIFSILNKQKYSLPDNYEIMSDLVYMDPDDANMLVLTQDYQNALQQRLPFYNPPDYFPIPALTQNLYLSEKYIGTLAMDEVGQPFRDGDYTLLHYVGQFIERYLRTTKNMSLGQPFEFEQIFTSILDHKLVEEERLSLFLDSLDFQPKDYFFTIVITPTKQEHNYLSLLALQITQASRSKCYLQKENHLIFVFKILPNRSQEDYLHVVLPILRDSFAQCGISQTFQNFGNLHFFYWQCLRALELGKQLNPTYWFYRFENYLLPHILQSSYNQHPQAVVPVGLQRLANYDQENRTDFLHILRVYLDQNMSLTATANMLFVHKNTLLYRLEKLKGILGMDLEDPEIRLILSVVLRILEVCHN